MVRLTVALECHHAGVVDADVQLIVFVILHRVRVDSVGLHVAGLFEKQKLGLRRRMADQFGLMQALRLVQQLLAGLIESQFQVDDVVRTVLAAVIIAEFG